VLRADEIEAKQEMARIHARIPESIGSVDRMLHSDSHMVGRTVRPPESENITDTLVHSPPFD
jgi:hypothetical protein